MGHFIADAANCDPLLTLVLAMFRSEEVVEWPKKGHTAEKRSSELTCIILRDSGGMIMEIGRVKRDRVREMKKEMKVDVGCV